MGTTARRHDGGRLERRSPHRRAGGDDDAAVAAGRHAAGVVAGAHAFAPEAAVLGVGRDADRAAADGDRLLSAAADGPAWRGGAGDAGARSRAAAVHLRRPGGGFGAVLDAVRRAAAAAVLRG